MDALVKPWHDDRLVMLRVFATANPGIDRRSIPASPGGVILSRMKDLWAGLDWSDADEQRVKNREALRILSCPRAVCRRRKLCLAAAGEGRQCPTSGLWPQSEEDARRHLRALYGALKRDVAECDANPEVETGQRAAWTEAGSGGGASHSRGRKRC